MTRNPGDNLQQFLEDVQEIDGEHQYKGQTLCLHRHNPLAMEMESSENARGHMLPVEATNIVNELLRCLQSRFEDMHENPVFSWTYI